jgi:predicted NAD-dependent protein-ADP-ribosyltransferase YbiA (DUF1768 family)
VKTVERDESRTEQMKQTRSPGRARLLGRDIEKRKKKEKKTRTKFS